MTAAAVAVIDWRADPGNNRVLLWQQGGG